MNLSPRFALILATQLSAVLFLTGLIPNRASAQVSACDLNQNGAVNVADVQLSVNMVLGITPCTANIVGINVCDIVVVQRVVNAVLGSPCLTDVLPSAHSVQLTWASSGSSSVLGYNVYRGATPGGPYTKVNSSLVTATTYTDTSVQNATTYYYVVTAVGSGSTESGYSNMATAAVPAT